MPEMDTSDNDKDTSAEADVSLSPAQSETEKANKHTRNSDYQTKKEFISLFGHRSQELRSAIS